MGRKNTVRIRPPPGIAPWDIVESDEEEDEEEKDPEEEPLVFSGVTVQQGEEARTPTQCTTSPLIPSPQRQIRNALMSLISNQSTPEEEEAKEDHHEQQTANSEQGGRLTQVS